LHDRLDTGFCFNWALEEIRTREPPKCYLWIEFCHSCFGSSFTSVSDAGSIYCFYILLWFMDLKEWACYFIGRQALKIKKVHRCYLSNKGKWGAQIYANRERIWLGAFKTGKVAVMLQALKPKEYPYFMDKRGRFWFNYKAGELFCFLLNILFCRWQPRNVSRTMLQRKQRMKSNGNQLGLAIKRALDFKMEWKSIISRKITRLHSLQFIPNWMRSFS
jgi:hypothetical protein